MDKKLLWQKKLLKRKIAKIDEEILKNMEEIAELQRLIDEEESGESWKN